MLKKSKYTIYNKTLDDGTYMSYYQPIEIEKDMTDIHVIVTEEYENKPGALAMLIYGTPDLFWIFGYYNRDIMSDLIFDLKPGLMLRLPSKERLLSYF